MPGGEALGASSSADAGTLDLQPPELRGCTRLRCKAAQGAGLRPTADDRGCVCSTGQGVGSSVYRLPFKLLKTLPFSSNQGGESMHPWTSGDAPGPLKLGVCVPATRAPGQPSPYSSRSPMCPWGRLRGLGREAEGWGQVTP